MVKNQAKKINEKTTADNLEEINKKEKDDKNYADYIQFEPIGKVLELDDAFPSLAYALTTVPKIDPYWTNDTIKVSDKSEYKFLAIIFTYVLFDGDKDALRFAWNMAENYVTEYDTFVTYCKRAGEIRKFKHNNNDTFYKVLYSIEFVGNTSDQLKEEIAKAKQIHNGRQRTDGKIWEEIIIAAEKYAFFKGAIRFLFTKEKIGDDWEHFNPKWRNVQKYFDKNGVGVKEDYKVFLTKSLVIQCNNWNDQLYDKQVFNPNASTWKWILCSSTWKNSVHNILLANSLDDIKPSNSLNDSNANQFIVPILDTLPYKVFIETEPTGRFRWNGILGYYKPYGQYAITFDWGGFHRNKIFWELIERSRNEGFRFVIQNEKAGIFWWGWDIQFVYKNKRFQWHSNGFVRIIDETSACKPILKNIEDGDKKENWYFFYTNGIDDSSSFLEKLDCLIAQAGTSDSEKLICENCQEKICEQTE